jgi:hypothetical protein
VYCCTTCQPLQLTITAGAAAAGAGASAAAASRGKQTVSRKRPSSKSSKQETAAAAAAAAAGAAAVAVADADCNAAAKQLLSPARLKSMAAAQVAKVGAFTPSCGCSVHLLLVLKSMMHTVAKAAAAAVCVLREHGHHLPLLD